MHRSYSFYTLSLLFFCCIIFSQPTLIKGKVKNDKGQAISRANILLLNHSNNEILIFKSTDSLGDFEFTIEQQNIDFDIKATHISHFPKIIPLINSPFKKDIYLEIELQNKEIQLEEIKIKGDFKAIEDKNDTIKYNLAKLLNGSEDKLKDIINKLPGLKIDDNGKIKFNGKIIDHFLIEGDQLYNNQHQLATENIISQMIAKIEVLKNYKGFSSTEDSTNKTALNIYIKEDYKNKVKGIIEIESGYKDRYKAHNYIFNFNNKIKASLIADINNLNYNIITVADYLDLKKTINQEISNDDSNNSLSIDDNVPNFLFAEDDAKSKTIKNITFNFNVNLTKKTKLQGYSVFNLLSQEQIIQTKKLFYSNENLLLNNNSVENGYSLFNSNYLKLETKPNEKNYLNYTVSTNYSKNKQQNMLSIQYNNISSNFYEKKTFEDFIFGQKFLYKKTISETKKFDALFYNEVSNSNNNLYLESDSPFLNLNFSDKYTIDQSTTLSRFRFGGKINLAYKKNTHKLSFQIGSSLLNEEYENYINPSNPNYNFKLNSQQFNNFLDLNYSNSLTSKTKLFTGLTFNHFINNIYNYSHNNNLAILPSASISHNLSEKIKINIAYNKNATNYTLNQFAKGDIIKDYITILKSNTLLNNIQLLSNQYSFNLTYSDLNKSTTAYFNILYNNKLKNIGVNSFVTNDIIQNENRYIDLDDTTYLFLIFEKKISKIPIGINFQSMISLFDKQSFSNFINNEIESFQSKFDINFISYFKNNDINFNCGISTSNIYSNNNTIGIKNTFKKTTPFINLNGLIYNDKLNWEIKSSFIIYSSSNFVIQNILDIRPKLAFKTKDWNYYISGNNILNIRNNNIKIKSSQNDPSFIEQSRFNSLPGYINIGTSFSF